MGLILHNIMKTQTGLSLFTLVIVCVAEPNVDTGRVSLETTEGREGASLETTETREEKFYQSFKLSNFLMMFALEHHEMVHAIQQKSVQLKVEHLMDLVHLVLESVVFLPCHAEGVLVRIKHIWFNL